MFGILEREFARFSCASLVILGLSRPLYTIHNDTRADESREKLENFPPLYTDEAAAESAQTM